jgi:hypothetical protein
MAYEILYARIVDLWDKLKEVKFSQLFPCVRHIWAILRRNTETVHPLVKVGTP